MVTTTHRFVIAFLVIVGLFAALHITAGNAEAKTPVYIGVGDAIIPQDGGGCNVAMLDKTSGFGVTAGHCGDVGKHFYSNGRLVGTIIASYKPTTARPVGIAIDYAVFRLAPQVVPINRPVMLTGVDTVPRVGEKVCKHGHGPLNAVVRCGKITAVSKTHVTTTIVSTPFDSGSPVINNAGQLVAVTSGTVDIASDVLGYLGVPGEGNLVGTRASLIATQTGIEPRIG